jgi:Collagen triple helix repeat (20 copies)
VKTISSTLLFILVIAAQAAWSHAGNNSSTVVHACIFKTAKFVRIIDANDSCKSYEIATHWNIQGEKGHRGLQGIQGIAGIQGLKGDKGDSGIKGIAGIQGADGRQGTQGAAGIQGLQGLKGDRGDTGVQGIAGVNGTNGRQGTQGTAGIQGQGLKGENGLKGNDGKSAYQLALDSGYVGELADWLGTLNGTDGQDGVNGSNGSQGIAGINGIQGPKGDTGPQGIQGEKGEKGDVGIIESGPCIQDDLTGRWVVFATQGNNDVRFTIDINAKGTLTGTNLYTDSKIPKDGELAGDLMMSENKESECFIKLSISKVGDQSVSILMEGVISPDHYSIIGGGIRDSFNEPSLLTNLRAIRVSPRA